MPMFIGTTLAQQGNLSLKSQAVLIFDAQQEHTIYDKKADNVMPIASITKLMTAMVVLDAQLPLIEKLLFNLQILILLETPTHVY